MKIIKTCFFLSLALTLLTSFNVYAVDQSICQSGANVYFIRRITKILPTQNDYVANNIRCKGDGPVSFYSNDNLESCVLSTDTTVAENKCKQEVRFPSTSMATEIMRKTRLKKRMLRNLSSLTVFVF